MSNKVMIDSSLLIEYIKGNKKRLLTELIANLELECFINETIVSEFFFNFMKVYGEVFPLSLQSSHRIRPIIEANSTQNILQRFSFLPTNDSIYSSVSSLMKQYNLLPNDAMIFTTCKIHNITKLASHDSNFIEPCRGEGIELLME